ncbi:MAG TPA: WYL domain-containing protein [Stellaceae bacterium]|nr:WYL domain-containing protein [Stellaceae bacterium]
MTRIERGFAILLLLSDGSMLSAAALAQRFEVSVRTIYRDIDMLSTTGVPIYADRGAKGGYRLLEGFFLPPVSFARDEAVAVLLALALARGLKVTPFARELEAAERKLVTALPKPLRPLLAETRRLIGFERTAPDAFHPELPAAVGEGDGASGAEARTVELFLKAVLDGTQIRFTYRSPYRAGGAPVATEAEPLGALWDRERWYLVGTRRPHGGGGERRFWRADRVVEIEASSLRAPQPRDFDIRRHLGRRWLGEAMAAWARTSPVVIRMRRSQAERLAADWYFAFARFEAKEADEVVMTYGEDQPARVLELVRWLGPGAELVEPRSWRSLLRDELRALLAAHA